MKVDLLRLGLLGAIGGGANAWLCYAQIPVAVGTSSADISNGAAFKWHVVPAGAFHGAALALIPALAVFLLRGRTLAANLVAAPLVGWLSGYLSWIPLGRSAFDWSWGKAVTYSFHESAVQALWIPLPYFGLVGLLYFLALQVTFRKHPGRSLVVALVVASGVLGSLWWWIAWKPWYFAVLHGTIWGVAVGWGSCSSRRAGS